MSPPRAFDQRSVAVLAMVIVVGAFVSIVWREHVSFDIADADPLLYACWLGMLGLAMFRVDPKRDAVLAIVAFGGGAIIETWGTQSGLWSYFTGEKPPLFILPAWPIAALATERIVRVVAPRFEALTKRTAVTAYALAMTIFVAALTHWCRSALAHPATIFALAAVVATIVVKPSPPRDLARFLAGALIGFPLELWGTTRECWVYWDGKTPPLVAVLSHGFATVAFARAASIVAGRLLSPRDAPVAAG